MGTKERSFSGSNFDGFIFSNRSVVNDEIINIATVEFTA
jgi:hypothetical protein